MYTSLLYVEQTKKSPKEITVLNDLNYRYYL